MFKKLKMLIGRREVLSKPLKKIGFLKSFKLYNDFIKDVRLYNELANENKTESIDVGRLFPILDEKAPIQPPSPHYYYQSLWLFRLLLEQKPSHHYDVGSQINMLGFISEIFRLTYIDIRDPQIILNENYNFRQDSVLELSLDDNSVHSISSLHVIEHIGLGRYGDPIDPLGHVKALQEITRVCAPGAHFYFSTPCGKERVDFNAHRVFDPQTIIKLLPEFDLVSLSGMNVLNKFQSSISIQELRECSFGCGFFHFIKR